MGKAVGDNEEGKGFLGPVIHMHPLPSGSTQMLHLLRVKVTQNMKGEKQGERGRGKAFTSSHPYLSFALVKYSKGSIWSFIDSKAGPSLMSFPSFLTFFLFFPPCAKPPDGAKRLLIRQKEEISTCSAWKTNCGDMCQSIIYTWTDFQLPAEDNNKMDVC